MINIKNIFEDEGFINYIVRVVSEQYKNNALEENWRPPSSERYDNIIKKFFPKVKRAFFIENNNIFNISQLKILGLHESKQNDKGSISYCFNFNDFCKSIEKYPNLFNELKNCFYIHIEEKTTDNEYIKKQVEKKVDNFLENKNLNNIMGIKYPSKYFFENSYTPCWDVIVFNNNILYEILIKKLYLNQETIWLNQKINK